MAKKKCIWKCGKCNTPLLVTKKGKKTKYLFCPTCKQMSAYYNFDILGALGSIGKSVVRSIPIVGGLAGGVWDAAEEALAQPAAATPSGYPVGAMPRVIRPRGKPEMETLVESYQKLK